MKGSPPARGDKGVEIHGFQSMHVYDLSNQNLSFEISPTTLCLTNMDIVVAQTEGTVVQEVSFCCRFKTECRLPAARVVDDSS